MRYILQLERAAALVPAVIAWACSGLVFLAGVLWGALLRCDESCSGEGWRHNSDAWQWHGVTALGVSAFLAGSVLVYSVWTGRRVLAVLAVALGLTAVLIMATLLSPEWLSHLDRRTPEELLILLLGVAAPIVAAALTPPAHRQPAEG
ncbi:MAG TPA: hypothetical protein VFW80_00010 [Gaiellaceae bacterium]|nr:hypothetical protein [Gaiellaceae bacterium]